jgi:hypothetical protein
MAAAQQQLIAAETQRRRRRQIDGCLRQSHDAAHRAVAWRGQRDVAAATRVALEESHPDFADMNARRTTGYMFLIAMLFAVCILDILVFGPTAEYLARVFLGGHPRLILAARFLIPAAFLLIELGIASKLYFASQGTDAARARGGATYWTWACIALLFSFVTPALVISTQMAAYPGDESERLAMIFRWQVMALVIIAFVTHLLVIFGGQAAHEAKTYVTYRLRHRRASRQIASTDAAFEHEAQQATSAFGTYLRTLNEHNTATPQSPVAPGPFDTVARELINERYGYEIIQSPTAAVAGTAPAPEVNGGAAPAAATPRPTPPPQGAPAPPPAPPADEAGDDAMSEYYRTLLARQVREQEGEVRP